MTKAWYLKTTTQMLSVGTISEPLSYLKIPPPPFIFHLTFDLRFICIHSCLIHMHRSFMLAPSHNHHRFKTCVLFEHWSLAHQWSETLISWSLGHVFREITTWHSFVLQDNYSWLCSSGIYWLTFEALIWSSKTYLWAHVFRIWLWNFMIGLKTLIRRCASWNPNQGCLVLVCHLSLTCYHGLTGTLAHGEEGFDHLIIYIVI